MDPGWDGWERDPGCLLCSEQPWSHACRAVRLGPGHADGAKGCWCLPHPFPRSSLQVLLAAARNSEELGISLLQAIRPLRPSLQSTDFIVGL